MYTFFIPSTLPTYTSNHRIRRSNVVCQSFFDGILKSIIPSSFKKSRFQQADPDPLGAELLNALVMEHEIPQTSPLIAASIPNDHGRGLITTEPVLPRQTIISIPETAIITPDTARRASSLYPLLIESKTEVPDWTLLALYLTELIFGNIMKNNDNATTTKINSFSSVVSRAYASILPAPLTIGNVLEWEKEEVSLLKGSHLHSLATSISTAADESMQQIIPCIQRAEHAGIVPKGIFTEDNVRHAFALLLSRLVRLENYSREEERTTLITITTSIDALVPWADFLNHSCTCTSFLQWDPATKAVVFTSDRFYSPGEQILACYGQKSNGELLLSYGIMFFDDENGRKNENSKHINPYDCCLLEIECTNPWKNESFIHFSSSSSYLSPSNTTTTTRTSSPISHNNVGDVVSRVFPLKMSALPRGLLKWCAFVAAPSINSKESANILYSNIYGDTNTKNKKWNDDDDDNLMDEYKELGRKYLANICREKISRYTMHIDDIKKELSEYNNNNLDIMCTTRERRRAYILQIILEELRILNRISFLMKQQQRNIR